MRNQQLLKLFLVLMICTLYFLSFSHFGALAYNSFFNKDDRFGEETIIGTENIAGKTETEALKLLSNRLSDWISGTNINLNYKEKRISLDLNIYRFKVDETIRQIKDHQKNLVLVDIDKESLTDILYSIAAQLSPSDLNINNLIDDLLLNAKMLEKGNYSFRIEDYLNNKAPDNEVIGESILMIDKSNQDLNRVAEQISSIEIPALTQLSLNHFFEKQKIEKLSPNVLSIIATGIYQSILQTNFSIIERHIGNELPDYATLGYEAKVNIEKNMDLIFYNPNESEYVIDLKKKGNKLYFSLSGPSFLNEYVINQKNKQHFSPKTIIQFSPLLSPAEVKIKQAGKDGLLVKVVREVYDEQGELLKEESIAEDFYPPIHRIEIYGLKTTLGQSNSLENNSDETHTSDEPVEEQQENQAEITDRNEKNNTGNDSIEKPTAKDDELWGKPNEQSK